MGSLGTAVLDLDTDNSRLNRGLDKAEGKTKGAVGGFSTSTLAIGAAFTGVGLAAKNAWDELANAQKVGAQTDAVLKSTSGAAGVTKKDVENLSGAISDYSGLDDEMVQSGANMLLTFTKIRNGVGANNQIFDRATKAIADVSVGLGKDMPGAAVLVGKALNDPLKGMTALGRAGVQFTQTQKDAITAMVDSGNTAGAQKLILKELEVQFGGSARAAGQTLPGQLAIARNAFDNMSAQLLSALIPALMAFARIMLGMVNFISANGTAVKIVVAVLGTMAIAVTILIGLTKLWAVSQLALNAVMSANPFVLVAVLLAGLVAGIIVAYRESETFRNTVQSVWNAVKSATTTAVNVILGLFNSFKSAITSAVNFVRANWPVIATIISGPFAPLVALATNAFGIRSALTGAFTSMLATVRSTMGSVISAIRDLWDNARSAGQTLGQNVWNGISNGIGKVSQLGADLWSKVSGAISSTASSALSGAAAIGRAIVDGAISGMAGLASAIASKGNSLVREGLSRINPFSPVEHGGQMFIGEPIVAGAVTGMEGGARDMAAALDNEIRAAVSGVSVPIGAAGGDAMAKSVTGALSGRGGGMGGGIHVHFNGTVIGSGNERSLARELAKIITPELNRQPVLS